jgi:cephalosporin-C deacetylase
MAQYDLPLAELRAYAPDLAEPAGLDAFWSRTLAETRSHPIGATFTPVDTGLTQVVSYDVTYAGFGGAPVKGWLHLPKHGAEVLPAVVEFRGYGGGRGLPHERVLWAAAGYAHLVMDTRGQGSGWATGVTPDPDASGDPAHPGFMTQGILDPERYYYRRVYVDGFRAVDAVRSHPRVDPARVAVTGASQGGGISVAVASLVDGLVGVMPDVPFLSDFPRAITFAENDPYTEVARYLRVHRDHVEPALATLAHFDIAILGRRATAPALFSVALMDRTCPPSTVYAAFNAYDGPREILEYPFNDHEGGQGFHEVAQLRWLRDQVGAPGR